MHRIRSRISCRAPTRPVHTAFPDAPPRSDQQRERFHHHLLLCPREARRRLRSARPGSAFVWIGYDDGRVLRGGSYPRCCHTRAIVYICIYILLTCTHCNARNRWESLEGRTHQFDIGTHLSYLPDLNHKQLIDLWIPWFVVAHC